MGAVLQGRHLGVVGLGFMGRPMALNLHRQGAVVRVHNRSPGPMESLVAEGLIACATPKAVAESSDVVIMMLTDGVAVEAVLQGANGILAGLAPGALVIDMGTTEVPATRRFAGEVEAKGGLFVDAPVSGGQVGAIEGTLTIMAGGSEAAFAKALPVFQVLGRKITHVGGVGAGQVAKAANQVIVALTIAAVAEAFTLAEAAGVDPARLREALKGGFADSRILDVHGRRMVEGDFAPGAKARLQLKDLVQADALAGSLGAALPTLGLVRSLYQTMVDRGMGDLDHAGLIRLFES
jgi:3-hydroxyisobutyrate dehydrogenase-like beta-hydroxyacid dehydrogenase